MSEIAFGAPQFLWLLVVPVVCVVGWVWRFVARLADLRRLRATRTQPLRERFSIGGDLWLWLCLTVSSALLVVALARPYGVTSLISRPGVDVVVLQDGSASMHVQDVREIGRAHV